MKILISLLLALCMITALGTVAVASGETESTWQDSEEANAIRERNRASVKLYFEVEEFSPEQDALLAPGFTMEQPFWGVEGAEEQSAASPEMPAGFQMPNWTPEWHWNDDLEIWGTDDPNFFFAHNSGWGLQLNGNNELAEYHNTYFHTFHFDENGQIDFYQEIGNPLNLMVAMGKEVDFPQPSDTLQELIDLYLEEHPEAAGTSASGEPFGEAGENTVTFQTINPYAGEITVVVTYTGDAANGIELVSVVDPDLGEDILPMQSEEVVAGMIDQVLEIIG